jgi:hypothetical protein
MNGAVRRMLLFQVPAAFIFSLFTAVSDVPRETCRGPYFLRR